MGQRTKQLPVELIWGVVLLTLLAVSTLVQEEVVTDLDVRGTPNVEQRVDGGFGRSCRCGLGDR